MNRKIRHNLSNLEISSTVGARGFKIKVFHGQNNYLEYPAGLFEKFPQPEKNFLIDNFVYARTRTLSLVTEKKLSYAFSRPYLKEFVDWGIKNDLGRAADVSKIPTFSLIKRLGERPTLFNKGPVINHLPNLSQRLKEKALLALSFGKDSLLSYGLIKEIGLSCQITTDLDEENYTPRSWVQRQAIFRSFQRKEHQSIIGFRDNIDTIHFNKKMIAEPIEELESLNGMLAFALELLPIAYQAKAKYLIFGNEKNLDDFYFNDDGVKSYPSFDQSSVYTKKLNRLLSKLTGGQLQIISLVESIYNLAEMKILFHRYPELLDYVMSCYPQKYSPDRWCYSCPMCAKAFLYSVAVGGDPQKIKMNRKMFNQKAKELYPLLASKVSRPYEKPQQVREEQLLAFLLAYRLGWRGYLIDLFKKKHYAEAVKKEKELRKKYFGIYPSVNLPKKFSAKILKIFREELKDLS